VDNILELNEDKDDNDDKVPLEALISGPKMAVQQYKGPITYWTAKYKDAGNVGHMGLCRMAFVGYALSLYATSA
jgi:hypothetical protein